MTDLFLHLIAFVQQDADLDSLPPPSLHRWIDLARYQRHGATIPIQTKRGCVYKCIYCTYRNVEGWGYRTRDPELVADEIEELKAKAGIHHFDFVDSTFNSPPGHALQVCEAITRRRIIRTRALRARLRDAPRSEGPADIRSRIRHVRSSGVRDC